MTTPRKISPEEMAVLLGSLSPSAVGWRVIERLRAHIAALEAELERPKPSGQVAEAMEMLRMAWWAACGEECDGTNHAEGCEVKGYESALSHLAAKAQGYEAVAEERDAAVSRADYLAVLSVGQTEQMDGLIEALDTPPEGDPMDSVRAIKQERDAAVADNAALLAWIDEWGHATWCDREHDKALRCTEQCNAGPMLQEPHPGAASLEQHRKALVRARNEGLERAAEYSSHDPELAAHIRALMEPEL